VHLFPSAARPTNEIAAPRPDDPDADLVANVQAGNADAFEDLVRRHTRRVFRTLIGILGDAEEAQDASQEAFLRAYEHIARFQGRSKFATWLVSIATNVGVQRLRDRRPMESLDEAGDDHSLRPRLVQAWHDDPEQVYSQQERRRLVERGVMRLPAPYRIAVMLRDIEQLPNEDAAAALNLSVPNFKARVFRGRCLLREMLAPHFVRRERSAAQ
jgi:RNA polymerase sigma-70 factor (ECF subfamily)